MPIQNLAYTVRAGKIEIVTDGDYQRNYKYIESFDLFEAAFAALMTYIGYDFSEIIYDSPTYKRWTLEAYEGGV